MATSAAITSWLPLKQRLFLELNFPKPLAYFATASELITMKALDILNHISVDPKTKIEGLEKMRDVVMRISLNFLWLEFLEGDISDHVKTWSFLLTAVKKECELLVALKKIKDIKAAEELSKTVLFAFLYLKNEAPEGMARPMVTFMDLEKHPLTEDLLRRYINHYAQEYGSIVKMREWRHAVIEAFIADPVWYSEEPFIERHPQVEAVLLNFAYEIRVAYHSLVNQLEGSEADGGAGKAIKRQASLSSKGILLTPYFKKSLQLYSAFAYYFNSILFPPKQGRIIRDIPVATLFNWQVEAMKRIIPKLKETLPKIKALGKPLYEEVLADLMKMDEHIPHADLSYLSYLEEYSRTILSSESSPICLLIERAMFVRSSRHHPQPNCNALIDLFNLEYKKSWDAAQINQAGVEYRHALVELAPSLKAWLILRASIDDFGLLSMEDLLNSTVTHGLIPTQDKIRDLYYAFDETPSLFRERLPCPLELEMFCPWPEVRALFLGLLA